MNIYLLSGLGADVRLFQHLDLRGHNLVPIKWSTPAKHESIEDYAKRIASQIQGNKPVLIGVSFGGMMSVEIGKQIPVDKIILISSAENFKELPWIYRIAGKLKLHKILRAGFLKRLQRTMSWIMGASDPKTRKLLTDMLRDTNEDFFYWSLDKIVTWKNSKSPTNIYRIHGGRDKVLPLRKADYLVPKGSHVMVVERADEVTAAIKKIIG